ncbi:MAG: thioredoxin [Gallionellales bacterium RIFOXYB12_FULL_54_9]|nr:MAG: thioredoxin [Gallionellales bacterium RIFOXYB12_FULL_54_9]
MRLKNMGINAWLRRFCIGLMLCLPLYSPAADFVLQDMQGKTQRLSDYRGKWVLVNFWATWCPPCLNELPELDALHKAHKDKDLAVIGIAMEYASAKVVSNFVKKHGLSYPIVLGNSKILAQIGDLEVLPTSYLYNPNGEKVSYQAGEVTREMIESYIKSKQGK